MKKLRKLFLSISNFIFSLFSIYIICVIWIIIWNFGFSSKQGNYPHYYGYNDSFSPPVPPSSPNEPTLNTQENSSKKMEREFDWIDSGKTRKTIFHINEKQLKDEIKKFGTHPMMSNPALLKRRGFNIVGRNTYLQDNRLVEGVIGMIDYPEIFSRNKSFFHSYTTELSASAHLSEEIDPMYPFLSFVQHIPYKIPPQMYQGKFINAFFVPLVILYERYGDCDSKSLLLGVFLCTIPQNTEKTAMILIRGKGITHALLAIKRNPLLGMTSLYDMKKGYYIVLEASSPGWAPGFISPRVADALKSGYFTFLELN